LANPIGTQSYEENTKHRFLPFGPGNEHALLL